jgi:hypothetical protein
MLTFWGENKTKTLRGTSSPNPGREILALCAPGRGKKPGNTALIFDFGSETIAPHGFHGQSPEGGNQTRNLISATTTHARKTPLGQLSTDGLTG